MELESSLRFAIEREEFELFYQPQVSFRTGRVVGVEALLRWRHPQKGLVEPSHFIGFAEESGLINPIGTWVLQKACAKKVNDRYPNPLAFRGAVEAALGPLPSNEELSAWLRGLFPGSDRDRKASYGTQTAGA